MASKEFPYKAAYVACGGGCHVVMTNPCRYGCVACGQCVEACPNGAIAINSLGVAEVDEDKCTACGACASVCPRELIKLHDAANKVIVRCSNRQKGPEAKAVCEVSCLGCGLCAKKCTAGAITIRDFLPEINEELCLSCGMCIVTCPRGALADLRGIIKK